MFTGIIAIFGTIKALLTLLALGAGTGLISWGAARLLPGLTGLVAACVLGGAVVIGTGGAGYLTATSNCANEAKLSELRFEKARLQQELDVAKESAAIQDRVVAEQQGVLESNAKVLGKLNDLVSAHKDDTECVLFPDELEAINELQ